MIAIRGCIGRRVSKGTWNITAFQWKVNFWSVSGRNEVFSLKIDVIWSAPSVKKYVPGMAMVSDAAIKKNITNHTTYILTTARTIAQLLTVTINLTRKWFRFMEHKVLLLCPSHLATGLILINLNISVLEIQVTTATTSLFLKNRLTFYAHACYVSCRFQHPRICGMQIIKLLAVNVLYSCTSFCVHPNITLIISIQTSCAL
jgi:hypothetical protein